MQSDRSGELDQANSRRRPIRARSTAPSAPTPAQGVQPFAEPADVPYDRHLRTCPPRLESQAGAADSVAPASGPGHPRRSGLASSGSPFEESGSHRSADLVHCDGGCGDGGAVSVYILEIRVVALSRRGPVGYGVDDLGREFEVPLDANLASDLVTALGDGRRPVVAMEGGRSVPTRSRDR